MSKALIHQYYNELHRARQFSGSANEETLKSAFANLLNGIAHTKNLELVREVYIKSTISTPIRPDGILRNILQLDFGYWESKDTKDDLWKEIEDKFKKGYPKNNILFEDTQTAILFQEGKQTQIDMADSEALLALLQAFINYERPEVGEFNKAIASFGEDLPKIIQTLREMTDQEASRSDSYRQKRDDFLSLCRDSINPNLGVEDVREMLIQHILTEEIFVSIFDNADYHRENNIAQTLYEVEKTFFRGQTKQNLLASIRPYYNTIKARANEMVSHSDKQRFLKIIYENFYKVYNPKSADKLGIVYTPNEIVKFMIEGTEYLLEKHFGKTLGDKGVEILDPCTGTGTYITELIEHIPPHQLPYKYEHEIHANEMALLPYYVANLNIEAVYQQKMNDYKEFNNLCFVDTLDNTQALAYTGKQNDLFGTISLANVERIKKQNEKKISVIIGNPPYNAKQENYNLQNANRLYTDIDKRIKETYIKEGTAQNQIVIYDMYTRFYRWASDRLNQNGILAFVTNRSFIDSRAFDGFRKDVVKDFSEIWILDTQSDVRANPKIAGTTHNVFGIQTGICITFLVKKEKAEGKCRIFYYTLNDKQRKKEKLEFLIYNKFSTIPFERITPDEKGNWINQTDNDFETFIPIFHKNTNERIFNLCFNGIQSNRDEWVYDLNPKFLQKKISFFIEKYNQSVKNGEKDFLIKWTYSLADYFKRKEKIKFKKDLIRKEFYRPFFKLYHYCQKQLNHRLTKNHYDVWGQDLDQDNIIINFAGLSSKEFACIALNGLVNIQFYFNSVNVSLYRYENGERKDNITDWALSVFSKHYNSNQLAVNKEQKEVTDNCSLITKIDIFHYVYAVLHNPNYRQKYEQNLKRDFPRIPLYEDFGKWASWGKALIDLHLNYETASNYELGIINEELKNINAVPKAKLKANKELGEIYIDEVTMLKGVPAEAWAYQLGNRAAIEWILDQYKESKPSDAVIAEKFNTYCFADYKAQVIDLLQKVCTVSVETMKIVRQM